jgi:catechol 2,3-dioxygenase-like lactoylglutathione lyase family enzyme
MIQKMLHTTIFVLDQDVAKDFYVDKLGFDLKVDHVFPHNDFRWLAVAPKGQPDMQIALMKVGGSDEFIAMKAGGGTATDPKDRDAMIALLKKGMVGSGSFHTADCRKTYEELKAKGVEFLSEPKDQFYGVEAVFKDPFGNGFSLVQPKNV